jgi:hypothetical protein
MYTSYYTKSAFIHVVIHIVLKYQQNLVKCFRVQQSNKWFNKGI